ncbi:hypothetical protein KR074_002149, partial [Drosophila pseudoananassae]
SLTSVMIQLLRKVRLPVISAGILRFCYYYGRVLGVVSFGIERRVSDGSWAGRKQHRFKWYCLSLRILCTILVCLFCAPYVLEIEDPYDLTVQSIRLTSCFLCSICILVLQTVYEHELLRMINGLLRLFRRVRCLWSQKKFGFGGKREFFLLFFKSVCLAYEFKCHVAQLANPPDWLPTATILGESVIEIGSLMIIHIGFLGYMSIAALYSEVNGFVRLELRRHLKSLERPGGGFVTRRHLRIVGNRLDECIEVYDEIERVGSSFHRLFELPVSMILMFKIFATAVLSFEVIIDNDSYPSKVGMWGLVLKSFADVILLTLAVHEAVGGSRVVRRLSLENCPLSEDKEWNMKWEMFLSRLNLFEFRVRPLGLFEVSNEVILFFFSGMITYFTYVVQYGMQTNRL